MRFRHASHAAFIGALLGGRCWGLPDESVLKLPYDPLLALAGSNGRNGCDIRNFVGRIYIKVFVTAAGSDFVHMIWYQAYWKISRSARTFEVGFIHKQFAIWGGSPDLAMPQCPKGQTQDSSKSLFSVRPDCLHGMWKRAPRHLALSMLCRLLGAVRIRLRSADIEKFRDYVCNTIVCEESMRYGEKPSRLRAVLVESTPSMRGRGLATAVATRAIAHNSHGSPHKSVPED